MFAEAFIEAGVPSGVINVIQTGRDNANLEEAAATCIFGGQCFRE
jgi:acyl-CoA reductase-like NAD-dependent aldehyde dehydrogenase